MSSWCNYSDLPSTEWWERLELIKNINKYIREDLHSQVDQIISLSDKKDLSKIESLINSNINSINYIGNNVCIELDFLASKLKYLKKVSNEEIRFGIELDLIPELVAKWRDEKLNKLI